MNLRSALLFCATVATLMPCCAQATTPALEARLRARISELSPQLTDNGHNPEQDDKLALSLAQLGDETAALALADTPDAQDEIWQWRTEQSALRGDWKAAKQAAQHVQNASVRADGFLVIARLACEKSDLVVARAALLKAMPVLDKAPASNQLAYAAWIWWRAGDVAAARRMLLDKAWPTALREDEADAQEWQRAAPTLPLSKRQTVIEFAASCGLLRDVLKRFDPDNKLSVQWMTANAPNPADLQFLFERVLSEQPTRPTALYTVALSLAQSGDVARARRLRDRARSDKTIEKPGYLAILQLMLAAELGDTQTFTKIADSWKQLNPDERASQELEGLPGITRVFRTEPATLWQLRAGASRAAIDDYANLLLRQPDLMRKFSQTLPALLAYYDAHDATKSRALVTALAAQIAVAGAREDIDSWNSSLAAVAAQERDAGHAALAAPIVGALVAHTPENFRPFQAVAFMEAGFAEAARQTFDPLQRLRQEQDLHKRINETTDETAKGRLQRQQNSFDWGYYAENEARYLAPDAPAAWVDAIEDPQQRVKVLQGWSIGLSPQLKLSPPHVKYTSSNGGVGIETKSTS